MRATVFRYFFSFFLALTLTAQAQVSVASSCHAKGLHLTQESIGLHLSPSQVEMHSKHSHGIDSSALHLTDQPETSNAFVKAKCSYCATGCSMVYLPTTVPVSLPPDLGSSDTCVSLVKHYKDALLDGLMRPPRS